MTAVRDQKISELAQATTVGRTDLLPMAQSGSTRSVDVQTLVGAALNVKWFAESGVTDLTAAMNAAITAAATDGKTVIVPAGTYTLSSLVTVLGGVRVEMDEGANFTHTADTNLFQIKPGGQLIGGYINTSGATFTSKAIFLDGSDVFAAEQKRTKIHGVRLKGGTGAGTGTAIHLSADGASGRIYGVSIDNVRIDSFEYGLRLTRSTSEAVNWVNGNSFTNVWGYNTVNFLSMVTSGGTAGSGLDGNTFFLDYQVGANSSQAINCNGRQNKIFAQIWDWTSGVAAAFGTGTIGNYAVVGVNSFDTSVTDSGTTNTIVDFFASRQQISKLIKLGGGSVTVTAPTGTNGLQFYLHRHDTTGSLEFNMYSGSAVDDRFTIANAASAIFIRHILQTVSGTAKTIQFRMQDVPGGTDITNLELKTNGSVAVGPIDAIATNATGGFLYVPSCAGPPTGTPTAITGKTALVVDSTNNKLYFYSGGAWRDAGP